MGFDRAGWRIDDAVHPFATGFGNHDVRITTRWDESFLPTSVYGAMHECGHGLYEEGIAQSLQRTPLGHAESLGMHESQSRLWENMVGRGRPFCGVLAPRIAKVFGGCDRPRSTPTRCSARSTGSTPSLIRVEADEVDLRAAHHPALRARAGAGRRAACDPRSAGGMERPLQGVPRASRCPTTPHGVLQDVHWAAGLIGYFPTYALGNLIAGPAVGARRTRTCPTSTTQLAAGELHGLREWLREHVHRHGSKFSTTELLRRVVGGPIAVGPFAHYLKRKLGRVYDLEPRRDRARLPGSHVPQGARRVERRAIRWLH